MPETANVCLTCDHTAPRECIGCGGLDGYPPAGLKPCQTCILRGPRPTDITITDPPKATSP